MYVLGSGKMAKFVGLLVVHRLCVKKMCLVGRNLFHDLYKIYIIFKLLHT